MEALLSADSQLFLFINHLPHSMFADELAKFFSGIGTWGAVWVVIAIVLFFREEKHDHWFFLPTILVTLGAFISENVFKALVARPRPTAEMGALIVGAADNFSFPSSHAVLAFAFAYVLSKEDPKFTVWFYFLAALIALSRVYLGVHYPLDILVGALLGWGIGYVAIRVEKILQSKKNTPGGFSKNL